MIPDQAIEAAHKAWREQAAMDGSIFEYNLRAAIEAAAEHMDGYKWPVGDDDNPHRDGDVQPRSHWIVNRDTGWGCDGCDWTGTNLKEYWDAHGKPDEYKIPF